MRLYGEDNLGEWSRKLRTKYGPYFRLYSGSEETIERWADRLSYIYGFRFEIEEDEEKTLENWSKLIGG